MRSTIVEVMPSESIHGQTLLSLDHCLDPIQEQPFLVQLCPWSGPQTIIRERPGSRTPLACPIQDLLTRPPFWTAIRPSSSGFIVWRRVASFPHLYLYVRGFLAVLGAMPGKLFWETNLMACHLFSREVLLNFLHTV